MVPVSTFAERHEAFRQLHKAGCFILPNPWDPGSAKWLAQAGFKALASTSSGFAFSQGKNDGAVDVATMLTHITALVGATHLPVNVDFEDGHARDLAALRDNVQACVKTGASGLSIEDATGNPDQPLYAFDEAVSRVKAAREAIDAVDETVMLVGRAECFIVGQPDMEETLRRLVAYAEAGADCLYAPALTTVEQIKQVVAAVSPKPVNVMLGPVAHLGFDQLAKLGVRRISTGGSLALSAWSGFVQSAELLAAGNFEGIVHNTVGHNQLRQLFS